MKKNMILLMAVLLGLCWYTTVGTWLEQDDNYRAAVENAESFEERELYLDAIEEYQNAMNYTKDRQKLMMRIASAYQRMGDSGSYLNQLEEIVSVCGPVREAVDGIYTYYVENGREEKAVEYIVDLKESYPSDPVVKEYYKLAQQNNFELYNTFQGLGSYYGRYAVYEYEGKYGVVDTAGEVVLEAVYDDIKIPWNAADGFPVKIGEKVYFISQKGYKTAQPEGDYEELGILSDQRILAKKDGKYGYLDQNLKERTDFIWDDATNFMEGLAAVKSGEKWAVINKKGEFLTDYVYDDVKRDGHNFCSRNEVVWVKENGRYHLINQKAEPVGNGAYEDVKAFLSQEPCAVYENGAWGYANTGGESVIPCSFEDAGSFIIGYAAVKDGGLWGYIGTDGEILIPCAYDEALSFNSAGAAPVKREDTWKLIQLGIYE